MAKKVSAPHTRSSSQADDLKQASFHEPSLTSHAAEDLSPEEKIAALEQRLADEIARRMELEAKLQRSTQEFEQILHQRTDLLQELIMQLQNEISQRDAVEAQLRKRTDVMHDFIKQLEQEMEERREAEVNLRLSEERFRTVIEKSPVGICIINYDGTFEYVNPAYCALFGYEPHELKKKPFSIIFDKEEAQSAEALFRRIFDGKLEMRGERTMRTKHGQRITVLTDSVHSDSSDGNEQSRKLLVFVLDITQRKQAEDMLRRAKVIIDKSPAVIYQFSLQPNFPLEFVSDNIKQFGFTAQDFTSGAISFLHHVHPDDREKVLDTFRHLSKAKADHLRREYRLLTAQGRTVWVEDNLMAVYDEQGNVTGYQGVLLDIDERRRAEEEINKALLKEKELIELKARFVTIASHEFRTPLTSILLSVGILRDFAPILSEEERVESLTRISNGVHHMTSLLQDLLVYGKAESGEIRPKKLPLQIRSWCSDFATQAQERLGQRHTLLYAPPAREQECMIDESMIRQILEHLLSNADKFSPEGSPIHFTVDVQDDKWIMAIQDSGIGIPKEDLPRIFEPFHRGTNIGNIGGTGMGLAIVQKMVDFLDGEISVRSDVGKGTTFTIVLPLRTLS
ncbi:MAG: PAS domain S-box protein [Bacteroidota bacterium]|nr:PAS domain S-box protein [Candidatus Kapabacteria bacterium]MDW8220551.1 PAS domain S-box protein [Bacteroidota bacterium]